MANQYKEVALSKEGAQALVKALSDANAKIVSGGKSTVKKATAKPKAKK